MIAAHRSVTTGNLEGSYATWILLSTVLETDRDEVGAASAAKFLIAKFQQRDRVKFLDFRTFLIDPDYFQNPKHGTLCPAILLVPRVGTAKSHNIFRC